MDTIAERIDRLLDQLEAPGLRPWEIEAIKEKVEYLQSLED